MPRTIRARRTWVRPHHEREWHAISAVVFGKLVVSMCRKQWREDDECEAGEHDARERCESCQRMAIESDRVVRGLEELMRSGQVMSGVCE